MDSNGAVRAVFPPIGVRPEQRSAATTGLAALLVKQRRFQVSVQRQDSGLEVFADKRPGNALDAGASFPTIVQQQAVAINIVAALMRKPPDGTKLLIGQMWY